MLKLMVKKSEVMDLCKSLGKDKLEQLKKEVISILEKKDGEDLKKAIDFFERDEVKYTHLEKSLNGEWIEKAGYGVGTVRIWKGKKYKKVSSQPVRWVRVFDKHDRGAASSMGKYIAQVKRCNSVEELYQFCMKQRSLFQDENGVDLPIMEKLRSAIGNQEAHIKMGERMKAYQKEDLAKLKDGNYSFDSFEDFKAEINKQAGDRRGAKQPDYIGYLKQYNDKYLKEVYDAMPKNNSSKIPSKKEIVDNLDEVEKENIRRGGDHVVFAGGEKIRITKDDLGESDKKTSKKKSFKKEMEELYDASEKAWGDFSSGSEIKKTPENSKNFYNAVKKFVDDNNIQLTQKHYDELEDRNDHSFNEALELAGAYGSEKKDKAIATNIKINKEYKNNYGIMGLLDLSKIDEFKDMVNNYSDVKEVNDVNSPEFKKQFKESYQQALKDVKNLSDTNLKKELKHWEDAVEQHKDSPALASYMGKVQAFSEELADRVNAKEKEGKKPIAQSYWMKDRKGNRINNNDAMQRIRNNLDEIDSIKADMKGKSKADNIRNESRYRDLLNDNLDLISKLVPEERKEMESEVDKHRNNENAKKMKVNIDDDKVKTGEQIYPSYIPMDDKALREEMDKTHDFGIMYDDTKNIIESRKKDYLDWYDNKLETYIRNNVKESNESFLNRLSEIEPKDKDRVVAQLERMIKVAEDNQDEWKNADFKKLGKEYKDRELAYLDDALKNLETNKWDGGIVSDIRHDLLLTEPTEHPFEAISIMGSRSDILPELKQALNDFKNNKFGNVYGKTKLNKSISDKVETALDSVFGCR